MSTRPAVEEVILGCTTTSAKIRALANAGYRRTEIAETLDIRYQHVRKVLVDAGITDGMTRTVEIERAPVEVEIDDEPLAPTSADVLLNAGFRVLGEWLPLDSGEFELSVKAPRDTGVYAFIVDDLVRYIGLTQTGFHARMGHYRRGHECQRTSSRIKKLIMMTLTEGRSVGVLIATPEQMTWNGLPVVTAAGLESGLIRLIRPDWNMLGTQP